LEKHLVVVQLTTLCSIGGAGKYSDYFRTTWKSQRWNEPFCLGAIIGGVIATQFLSDWFGQFALSSETISDLK